MELISALKWPVLAFAGLVLGLAIGYTAKGVEDELRLARAEGLCQHSKSWEAFVAADSGDFVCFKQQRFNKRVIKYSIVGEIE